MPVFGEFRAHIAPTSPASQLPRGKVRAARLAARRPQSGSGTPSRSMLTSLSPVASPAGIRATKASDTTPSPAATRQWGPMRRFERWHPATERCATQPSAVGSAPSHWRRFAGGRLAHRGSPEGTLLGCLSNYRPPSAVPPRARCYRLRENVYSSYSPTCSSINTRN